MSHVIKHEPKLWERIDGTKSYFLFWCPACRCGHVFWCGPGFEHPRRWEFNGSYGAPTFTPSLRMWHPAMDDDGEVIKPTREVTDCHLNVTKGEIVYHGDNPHAMKGKTVPMEDIPEDYGF